MRRFNYPPLTMFSLGLALGLTIGHYPPPFTLSQGWGNLVWLPFALLAAYWIVLAIGFWRTRRRS